MTDKERRHMHDAYFAKCFIRGIDWALMPRQMQIDAAEAMLEMCEESKSMDCWCGVHRTRTPGSTRRSKKR